MVTYFIRFMMFLILFLPQPTHSSQCYTKVASCPHSEDAVTERRRTYNCSSLFFYTCLPDADYTYYERCSPAFYILNGTGGCPYIVKCHKRVGFIYGNTGNFKPCPQNKTGCPPVYHSSYKIQDLYKYPACFYKNGNIPLVNVKMALKDHNQELLQIKEFRTTETTNAVSPENQIISTFPVTVIISLAVFLSLSIVTNIFVVTYFTVYKRRKWKNTLKEEERTATTVPYLEERVPLSLQESSVMDVKDVPYLEERVPLSLQESSVMDVKDVTDVHKPILIMHTMPSTWSPGSSESDFDVRVRTNLSLDKDFRDTS